MNYRDFEDLFADVAVDEQIHVNHDTCPAGLDTHRRLYIKRTATAILAYCHNCGEHYVRATGKFPYSQLHVEAALIEEAKTSEVCLPSDVLMIPSEWPTPARAWLYQYGIDDADMLKYNICYSPSWGRVILPVYDAAGTLVFWQGRNVDHVFPKYISVKGAKKPLFFAPAARQSVGCHTSKWAVVVEDMVSAIAASKSVPGWDGVALLGTHMSDDVPALLADYSGIYIWLDPDIAGQEAAIHLGQRLATLTKGYIWVQTKEKAPKHLSSEAIKRILTGVPIPPVPVAPPSYPVSAYGH